MKLFQALRSEISNVPAGTLAPHYFIYLGFQKNIGAAPAVFRANGVYSLFTLPKPVVLPSELFAGNTHCLYVQEDEDFMKHVEQRYAFFSTDFYANDGMFLNRDHFAPNYRHTLAVGVPGLIAEVDASLEKHKADADKVATLQGMRHALCGFRQLILNYAQSAEKCKQDPAYDNDRLDFIIENCTAIAEHKPETFAQALQLVWLCHSAFDMENRGAMALGRMDQYLYPFYKADKEAGRLTDEATIEYLENIFIRLIGNVVNICIGGQNVKGECEVNDLSRCILRAVNSCHVPGPNLSLRYTENIPDDFFDECLQVIGTGLGYPAMMNDDVNIAALKKHGYSDEDVCDYCMVGCIENFITGKQPPWTDGVFNTPMYLDYLFNRGQSALRKRDKYQEFLHVQNYFDAYGLDTGDVENIHSMEEFMTLFEKQLAEGIATVCACFNKENTCVNMAYFPQPFLSCFCDDCIGRGLDINNGGAVYPSVHGFGLMGISTICDSLAAIEKVVFVDQEATLAQVRDALNADYEGYEWLQEKLLAAPKYGNNDDFADKYAVWFSAFLASCLKQHRTRDNGYFYAAAASNTHNVWLGRDVNATPDGRNQGTPLSDAASPTYGKDKRGPIAALTSLSKPDYTNIACGSVVNQKYSPNMFSDEKRSKLAALIRTYFKKGGQEIQINATSRKILIDAMEHPENYQDLVVRVSGFSAFYVTLDRNVQVDILNRTQQG